MNGKAQPLGHCTLLSEHQRHLRTNNSLERLMRDMRRPTRVGAFPDGQSALMLAAARLTAFQRGVIQTNFGCRSSAPAYLTIGRPYTATRPPSPIAKRSPSVEKLTA